MWRGGITNWDWFYPGAIENLWGFWNMTSSFYQDSTRRGEMRQAMVMEEASCCGCC